MSRYNITIPLATLGIIVGSLLIMVLCFVIFARKVKYTPPHESETYYYEPRQWAICIAFLAAILLLGFIR